MNLLPLHATRNTQHVSHRHQSGSAVIVVMALLAIMLIYVAGNLRTLNSLDRELKLLELKQTRRLQTAARQTNTPPVAIVSTNNPPTNPLIH